MRTKLIGILNITPDSFSDGGRYTHIEQALAQAEKLINDGAAILDIGAESTRPGATPLTDAEEWQRLEYVLPAIKQQLQGREILLSIDTYHPETARKALEIGVDIVNDVSGCESEAMQDLLGSSDANVIIMHNRGVPADHNIIPEEHDAVAEVRDWAAQRLELLARKNIAPHRVIFDPGVGFGKNASQSLQLLCSIEAFKTLGVPLCVGHSRKSFLSCFSKHPAQNRDIETLAVSLHLAIQGVDYVRVHDVESHNRAFRAFAAVSAV